MACKKIFLLLFLFVSVRAFSQSHIFYTASSGIIYYNGDLNDKRLVPPTEIFNFHYQFGLGYNLDKNFDLRLLYLKGKVEGADSLSNEYDNKVRNLSFRSKIDEIALYLYFKLYPVYEKKKINPYAFIGYGWFWFDPETQYNGQWYELQPLGTEGQYLTEGSYPKPYKLRQHVWPLGVGANIRLSETWKIKVEFSEHFTSTDYLDDASGVYPDLDQLKYQKGEIAAALSNRRLDKQGVAGRSRANAKKNDNYNCFSVGLIYNPRRKHADEFNKIGFLNRLFSGKHGWWGHKGKGLK